MAAFLSKGTWRWLLAGLLVLALCVAAEAASGKKKKKLMPKGDKKDNVVGAIWAWEAKEAKSGEVKKGRFRVADFVIYDITKGKPIGKITPQEKQKSQLTLSPAFDLPGKCAITQTRLKKGKGITVWSGVLKSGDAQWNLSLRMVDQ